MTPLTGTLTLARAIVRRDRIRLSVWIFALTATMLGTVASFPTTFPTEADRQARVMLMESNPAFLAIAGPAYGGEDAHSLPALTNSEMLGFMSFIVAFMGLFLVIRNTRAEEEGGRSELVRSTVVGRHAPLAAAVLVASGAVVIMGVLIAVGLPPTMAELPVAGSWLFGTTLIGVGVSFAAIGAVSAQIFEHARGAAGFGSALIGAAFVLRAAGNLGADPVLWLSPLGWAQETRPYVGDRWWPLLITIIATGLILAVAIRLQAHRDVGAGLVALRSGDPRAADWLGTPVGLALRLQRSSIIGWSSGVAVLGLFLGGAFEQAAEFIAENEAIQGYVASFGDASPVDATIATYLSFTALAGTAFAIASVLRIRGEEAEGRAEPILATRTSRLRWVGGQLSVTILGTIVIFTLFGLAAGVVYAGSTGDSSQVARMVGLALVHVPAVLVFAGVTMTLVGALPRHAVVVTWSVFGVVMFLVSFGPLLGLPAWVLDLSPFGHTPAVPAVAMSWTPVVVLTGVAATLFGAGASAFRRRDLAVPA